MADDITNAPGPFSNYLRQNGNLPKPQEGTMAPKNTEAAVEKKTKAPPPTTSTSKPSVRQLIDARMFTVEDHDAKLVNLNTRAEKHGETTKPAADIKVDMVMPHTGIACFGDSFQEFLFREPGAGESRVPDLKLDGGDKRTKVRNPEVKKLPLDVEYDGYTVVISVGLRSSKPVEMTDCRVRGFTLEALDGGAVKITFTISGYPNKDQIGSLFDWQRRDINVTLRRPKASIETAPAGAQLN